jgi:hypothetical protein
MTSLQLTNLTEQERGNLQMMGISSIERLKTEVAKKKGNWKKIDGVSRASIESALEPWEDLPAAP